MPSRMDGSKPDDWTGFDGFAAPNTAIPEVEILSDSELDSGWDDAFPINHNSEHELRWRRREEDYHSLARNEQRNRTRSINLNIIISEIESLWDAGDDAEFHNRENYDWNHHNQDLAWLENERQRLENAIVRSERDMSRREREITNSWRPPPRRRRGQRNLTNNFNVTNFERY